MSTSTTPTGKRSTDVTNLQVDDELWVNGQLWFDDGSGGGYPFVPPQQQGVRQISSTQDLLLYGTVASNILTLPSGYTYDFSGILILADIGAERIVISGDATTAIASSSQAAIIGVSANPIISYATTTDGNAFILDHMNVYNFGTGDGVSVSLANTGVFGMERGYISTSTGTPLEITIASLGTVQLEGPGFSAPTGVAAVSLAGGYKSVTATGGFVEGGFLDLGTAVINTIAVSGTSISIGAGSTAFTGAASSANIDANGFGVITGVALNNNGGTALSGIADADARWVIQANGGF